MRTAGPGYVVLPPSGVAGGAATVSRIRAPLSTDGIAMSDERGLFDLSTPGPPPVVDRAGRGRAGSRFTRMVTAEVTVQRLPVLLDAAVRAFDGSAVVDLGEIDAGDMDLDEEAADSREQIGGDAAAALGWLLDPTDGNGTLGDVANDAVTGYAAIDWPTAGARCRRPPRPTPGTATPAPCRTRRNAMTDSQ